MDILDRAFHDDPLMQWISQHPDFRRTLFNITLPFIVQDGLTYIEERGRGAAAWLQIHRALDWPVTPANLLRLYRVTGVRGFYRCARAGMAAAKFRPRQPHYYLFLLGALPECQGQGVGSTLISHVLRKCDNEKMPAYLENSKRENIRFYQGHGFEVIDRCLFARGAPPVWFMWREPNPAV